MEAPMSREKARKVLHDKEIRGHPLTRKQRGLIGAIASGTPLRRVKKKRPRNKVVTSYNFYRED